MLRSPVRIRYAPPLKDADIDTMSASFRLIKVPGNNSFRPPDASRWKSRWLDFPVSPRLRPVYSYTILPVCRVRLHDSDREACIFIAFMRYPVTLNMMNSKKESGYCDTFYQPTFTVILSQRNVSGAPAKNLPRPYYHSIF